MIINSNSTHSITIRGSAYISTHERSRTIVVANVNVNMSKYNESFVHCKTAYYDGTLKSNDNY
jgi:hypothetical protein